MISLSSKRSAFTLIELLAVIAIIGILAGMIGSASFAARQSSYKAQAQAEAREIANACRSYWIASGTWKSGSSWPGATGSSSSSTTIVKDSPIYKALTGDNQAHVVFLELDEERFDGDEGEYLDPWGNPYIVKFDAVQPVEYSQKFSSSVTFPMRDRFEYYSYQFEP